MYIRYLVILLLIINPLISSDRLRGPYLGQKKPGEKPEIFAPGIVSAGNQHSSAYFSPDGLEVYYSKYEGRDKHAVFFMKDSGNGWSSPATVKYLDNKALTPFISPDGETLYCSLPHRLYEMKREGTGWSKPVDMGSRVNLQKRQDGISVSLKGTLFFTSMFGKKDGMYMTRKVNGVYTEPVKLNIKVKGNRTAGYPAIAPDESYLIFQSFSQGSGYGKQDLFICFKKSGGGWTDPVNMGRDINSKYNESFPYVSADGKFLFFNSNRPAIVKDRSRGQFFSNVYWISTSVVEKIRERIGKK